MTNGFFDSRSSTNYTLRDIDLFIIILSIINFCLRRSKLHRLGAPDRHHLMTSAGGRMPLHIFTVHPTLEGRFFQPRFPLLSIYGTSLFRQLESPFTSYSWWPTSPNPRRYIVKFNHNPYHNFVIPYGTRLPANLHRVQTGFKPSPTMGGFFSPRNATACSHR